MKKPGSLPDGKVGETLSIVAHQLKNPISVIKAYLEALFLGDCGKVTVKQKEYLKDALANLQKMKEEVEELLIAETLEEGQLKLDFQAISLEKLAMEVINDFSFWAEALNCKIIFDKGQKLPKVMGDLEYTRQVIENLIANALKYSLPVGRIEISLKKERKEVIFSCKDTGIGIPYNDRDKVFTKFYRSGRAMEMEPSGSGLGLYINKKIIKESGGRIWFDKNEDFGVTFHFSLPIAK